MKTIYTLLLISAFVLQNPGQTVNSARQPGMQTTYGMVSVGSKSFYLEKTVPDATGKEWMYLVALNKSGVESFRKVIYLGFFLRNTSLAVFDDASLLIKCETPGKKSCEFPEYETTIAKMDTAGIFLWVVNLTKSVDCLVPFTGNSFYAASGSTIYHYDAGAKLISTSTTSFGTISSGVRLNANAILWNYANNQGVPGFRETDSTLTMINDLSANSKLSKLGILTSGEIIGLTAGHLEKYSSTYLLLATTSSVLSTYTVTDFITRNDSVFFTGTDAMEKFCYAGLNASFQLFHQNISNVEKVLLTGITVNSDNLVRIIGTRSTGASGYSHSSFFQTSLGSQVNGTYDIGVVRMNIKHHFHDGGNSQLIADVTIKNFGNTSVNYFRLHSFAQAYAWCYHLLGLNQEFFTTIAPGDTATVTTNMFNSWRVSGSGISYGTTFEVCIHSAVPNNENDIEAENDRICEVVTFLPVGLSENTLVPSDVSVFPNPSSDIIVIKAGQSITEVSVFDLSGRLITSERLDTNIFSLPSRTLSSGMYLFKIKTEKGDFFKKVIIE